jgi:hypothetical protein
MQISFFLRRQEMKCKTTLTALACSVMFATPAFASEDAQKADLQYKGNPCEKCWINSSDRANSSRTPSVSWDTAYFHSEGEAHARAEYRMATRTTGAHRWKGNMMPTYWANGTKDIAVFQIFSQESGKPRFMLGLDSGGYFYNEIGGDRCSNGIRAVVGTSYKVSATYDSNAGSGTVWVNDRVCGSFSADSSGGQLFVKIGAYRTNSGAGSITTRWSDFGHF